MATFSGVAKGTLRRERASGLTTVHGVPFACDVRAFSSADDAVVLRRAREYAKAQGVDEPKDGEPLYELGKWLHTLLLACVDPDSPGSDPKPFFDGGERQVLEHLDRDRMAFLVERQAKVQDDASLGPRSMTVEEAIGAAAQMAEVDLGAELPFRRWRPNTQEAYLRITAALLTNLPGIKSPSSAPSSGSSANSSSPTEDDALAGFGAALNESKEG